MVRVSRLYYPITVLGPGRRLGIWVQGCTLGCAGCVARDTWDAADGEEVSAADLAGIWARALSDGADGITVSGGEPLQQADAVADLLEACAGVARRLPEPPCAAGLGDAARDPDRDATPYDVLMYTGYEREELLGLGPAAQRALSWADALITGRYQAGRPTGLVWRGSANQQLIPRTRLGRERYGIYAEHEDEAGRLQVDADETDLRLIGIPRRGELSRLERELRAAGVRFEGVSWRP